MSGKFASIFQKRYSTDNIHNTNIYNTYNLQTGKIIVLAIPPGARIYIDDVDTGVNASAMISDISISVPHTIKLTLSGYNDFEDEFTMTESGETMLISTIMIPTIPPVGTGSLNVTSTPSEAEFYIYSETDEIANEITPTLEPITDIPAGIYAYGAGIAQNGVSEAMGSVIIKAGETTNLHIPLPSYSPDNGVIAIESIPIGANIYIDGETINTKTSYATMMAPGPHTYELRMSGYQNKSGEFIIVTGYDMPVIVSETLQPVSGTGTMVMLAGAVVLGMILMPKK